MAEKSGEFFVVWNEHNWRPPRHKHKSSNVAHKEAGRLASLNPGKKFHVLRAVGSAITDGDEESERMLIIDIETVPNEAALQTSQWAAYKARKGIESDQDAALHPAFGMVCCAVVLDTEGDGAPMWARLTPGDEDDADLLRTLSTQLPARAALAGHNIKGFDLPFLACRYLANGMPVPPALNVVGLKPWEVPHVDTCEMLKFGGRTAISLDDACLMMGIPSPKTSMHGSEVWQAYRKGRIDEIVEYCTADVRATGQLLDRINAGTRRTWPARGR